MIKTELSLLQLKTRCKYRYFKLNVLWFNYLVTVDKNRPNESLMRVESEAGPLCAFCIKNFF